MISSPPNIYQLPIDTIENFCDTNFSNGLTATQVDQRQKEFGKNILVIQKKRSWIKILLQQFINPLVWVLGLAVVIAFFFGERMEGFAILIVIFLNAGIGFFMEIQANRSMTALRKLSSQMATVLRNKTVQNIESIDIVPGDIILLNAGDIVPADARIFQQHNLGVQEAALTGESMPISKTAEPIENNNTITDRKNALFKGTIISRGNAKAVVTQIGKDTEIGRITLLTEEAIQAATPIEKKLNDLAKKLLWLTLVLTLVVIFVGFLQGQDLYLMSKTAIALAIAAIPEGLPVVATIGLAKGMLRLASHAVIVKKLSAVETLGEVQIIFTDKTGTLTENQLSVQSLLFSFGKFKVHSDQSIHPLSTLHHLEDYAAFEKLMLVSVLCNDATLGKGKDEMEGAVGDPLETALLHFGKSKGFSKAELNERYPRIKEIPFDAKSKMMGTLHEWENGKFLVCIKGALEVILEESDYEETDTIPRNSVGLDFWKNQNNQLAAKGERTLAFGYSILENPEENFFKQLNFIGCIGFFDPPRPDIKPAIQTCVEAGIQVIMVTGDHPETAKNIAHQVGLVNEKNARVLHGNSFNEIDTLNNYEISNLLDAKVFARVSPSQKLELVRLFQQQNHIVAMTGDGVNDAPALKKSDIGIAMGKRGTEAAKEAADLILEDDSFSSIVEAVKQGRGIFSNIRHFVVYLLSCNLGEIFVILLATLLPWGTPLFPLQILFLNMITDVFPALALGMGKTSPNVMLHPPRKTNEPIITGYHWQAILIYALAMSASVLGINYMASQAWQLDNFVVNSLVFYTLILVQLWQVFNLPESAASFFNNEVTNNRYVWGAILLCLLIPIVLYYFESVRTVLNLRSLSLEYFFWTLGFSLIPTLFIQLLKRTKLVL
jgi:Ca2+-transporting ATPase